MAESNIGITVKKSEDIASWYGEVCQKSELADYAPVKGCMIIRPRGYMIWQAVQDYFNPILSKFGVKNAYFPIFIPEHFFHKEKEHAKGFTPEVAWIERKLDDEPRLALRPTSETIMYDSYSRWVRSHRDLPLRINQWCNIIRWETDATKLFLRSREFLWQEGHCVYESEEECMKEVLLFLNEYKYLCEHLLAFPVIPGLKTEGEKFAGAKKTFTIEALMPDGKALQCGTSHNLGQGFARSFEISYLGSDEESHFPWQNSWGISTRLIGAVVLTHSDDKGLVLPPRVCDEKVVIVPILFDDSKDRVLAKANEIRSILHDFGAFVDDRDYRPGFKFNEWELKGIPLRIELGPKDLEKGSVVVVRRDTGDKMPVKIDELKDAVPSILDIMHNDMFDKAKKFLDSHIKDVGNLRDFEKLIKEGNLVFVDFCGSLECEKKFMEQYQGITPRCIPLDSDAPKGKCLFCGKDADVKVLFGRSY